MIKLFLISALIFLLVAFVMQLRKYLARNDKADELKELKLQGDLIDIDKAIAEERARQQAVTEEINTIKTPKDHNND